MTRWLRVLAVTLLALGAVSLRSAPPAAVASAAVLQGVGPDPGVSGRAAESRRVLVAQQSAPGAPGRLRPPAPAPRPSSAAPSGSFRAALPPAAQAELARIRAESQRIRRVRAPSPIVLKILQPAPDAPVEVDAIGANWKQTTSVRFRWRTAQAGAASAVYQVSLFPFAPSLEPWALPPGSVTCGPAGVAPGQPVPPGSAMLFDLDLRTFAPVPGMKPSYSKPSAGQGGLTPRLPPGPLPPPPIQTPGPAPHSMLIPGAFPAPRAVALPVATTATSELAPTLGCALITQESQKARHNLVTHNPLTYFVRVVTVGADGQPSAAGSAAVTITYHMEDPPQPVKILPPTLTVSVRQYAAIHWARSGYQYRYQCTRPFVVFCAKAGDRFELHPGSGCSGLDCVGEAIGDAADSFTSWVEDAVNWVSKAYGSLKEAALNVAMKLIPGDCGPCRTALKLGLDYGLTCLGMPPELPNFDQLVALGKGYLVQQLTEVASQQAGVPIPPEVTKKLVDEVVERAKQVEQHGPDGSQWFKPDPDYQYAEPYVVVRVQNPSAYTRKGRLWIMPGDLYWGRDIDLPVLGPHAEITVPLVLKRRADAQVDTLGRPTGKPGSWEHSGGRAWLTRYYAGSEALEVRVTDVSMPDLPTAKATLGLPGCAQLKAGNPAEPC